MEESDRLEREISRLVTAINKIDGAYYFCARRMSLRENTLALLYALHDGQPHTQKQIVEDWLIPKTTINTAVRELKREGYLALTPLPHSREKALVLTEAGREHFGGMLARLWAAEQEALCHTLAEYPPEFVDAFDHFAQRLCQTLEERILSNSDKT